MLKKIWPAFLILFLNCNNSSSEPDLSNYYHEYLIYVLSPSDSIVTCEASFQKGGKMNRAAPLPEGYEVFFNDQPVASDNEENPIYKLEKRQSGFFGNHTWKIKYKGNTVIEIPVSFTAFKLVDTLTEMKFGTADISVKLEGALDGDQVECIYHDDSYEMNQFFYPVKNNAITLPVTDMRKMKPGHYEIELSLIKTRPAFYKEKNVGNAETNYTLERFEIIINH